MASVSIQNVTKVYKESAAVRDFSLDIADGEFLVLLGPSGCGKSTTLRMVAGLEKPTSGNIYIGDTLVNEVHPKDRDVAMVFQSYALYPHMTVHDNLAFPLKMRGYSKEEMEKTIGRTAEILEISELLGRRPRELSGGQRQRVALGRAIVRNPKVFLMDEPLSNLDAKLRVQTRVELKNLQKRIGTTTIYVTHDQAEAMTLADRVAIMKQGMIQQVASPIDVYSHPVNRFVAGFIGSPAMNFVDGRLTSRDSRFEIDAGEFRILIGAGLAQTLGKVGNLGGRDVTYGIRAEDVRISQTPEEGATEFDVFGSELMGSEQFVHGVRGKTSIIARAPMGFSARIGGKTWMTLTSDNAHVFDRETEKTLV